MRQQYVVAAVLVGAILLMAEWDNFLGYLGEAERLNNVDKLFAEFCERPDVKHVPEFDCDAHRNRASSYIMFRAIGAFARNFNLCYHINCWVVGYIVMLGIGIGASVLFVGFVRGLFQWLVAPSSVLPTTHKRKMRDYHAREAAAAL